MQRLMRYAELVIQDRVALIVCLQFELPRSQWEKPLTPTHSSFDVIPCNAIDKSLAKSMDIATVQAVDAHDHDATWFAHCRYFGESPPASRLAWQLLSRRAIGQID